MQNLLDELKQLLKKDDRLVVDDELLIGALGFARPVPIFKVPPVLWIDGPDSREILF